MSSKKRSKANKSMDKLRAVLNVGIKKLSPVLPFAAKFIGFFLAFRLAAGTDLYDLSGLFGGILCKSYVHVALALVCALLPSRFGTLLVILFISVGLVKASIMGGALLAVFMLVIFLVTVCFVPDYVYFLLLLPFLISKGFYLLLPLLAGLFGSPLAVIAIFMGVFMWGIYLIAPALLSIQSISADMELKDIIKELPSLLTYTSDYGVKELIKNKSLLIVAMVLCAVCFLCWLLCKLRTNYNRYIAIAAAGFFGLLGLLVGKSLWGMYGTTGLIVLLAFAAMAICALLCFLDLPLDYKGVRNISFSDDEYFYQVRLTPLSSGFTAARSAMLDKKSKKKAKAEEAEKEKEDEDKDVKRVSKASKAEEGEPSEAELSEDQKKAETKVLSKAETREIRDAADEKAKKAEKAAAEKEAAEKAAAEKAAAKKAEAEKAKAEKAAKKAAREAEAAEKKAKKEAKEASEKAEGKDEKSAGKSLRGLLSSLKKEAEQTAEEADEAVDEIRDVLDSFEEETGKEK